MSEPKKIYEGRNLMLFDSEGHSYAYAQNHVLTVQANTSEVSTKDHGIFNSAEIQNYTWTITSENLATDEYDALFGVLIAGQPVTIKFGLKAEDNPEETVADGDLEYWTLDDSDKDWFEGSAIVTSLELNAQNGEKANYSIEFQGVGKLEKKTPPPVNFVMDMSRTNKYRIDSDHETLIWEEVVGSQTVMVGTQEGNVITQGTNYVTLQMSTGNIYAIGTMLSGYSKVKKVSLDIEISEARQYGITLGDIQQSMSVGRKTYTWNTDFSATLEGIGFYSSGTQANFKLYGITLELER